ncbi:MAG: GntR family transcriptional regulator [Gaiellales bacterium]
MNDPAAELPAPLRVRSVVGLAYDEIRAMIVDGRLGPGARVGQAELAQALGISRGSVREALRRLVGDGLLAFEVNRGFFVADLGLDRVLERLEARLLLEPLVARLAAERRTDAHLAALERSIADERAARSAAEAHDASRAFHAVVVDATGNEALRKIFDSLWIADVGRRLLARRRTQPAWQAADIAEHVEIHAAIDAGDSARAEALMRAHVEAALRHWEKGSGQAA